MLKVILEFALWAFILLGSVAVVFVVYTGLHSSIYDPSLPHDTLWKALFGPSR